MSSETSDESKVESAEGRPGSAPEQARRELEEEFNVQRARMKELFLQKEEDMRKVRQEKEQLESEVLGLRAELQQLQTLSHNQKSEIQSLQLLVNETVEASSSGSEEVRRLTARALDLERELNLLRQQNQPQSAEEGELLRSINQALHDEIAALKGKLRDTDTQLQEALKSQAAITGSPVPTGSSGDIKTDAGAARRCDMCANYEKQLVAEQAAADAARDRAHKRDTALKLATEELEGVRSLHDETVRAWHAERAAAASTLQALQAAVGEAQATLLERAASARDAESRALHAVTTLTVHRETLQKKLDSLERDNAYLIGQYTKKAAELQNEFIDLPDNVEELQELALRLREQMIVCAVGREEAARAEHELRAQLLEHTRLLHQHDAALAAARAEHSDARKELEQLQTERGQLSELGDKLRAANDLTEQLLDDKRRLAAEAAELRGRVGALQQELDNSEKVQQDFVRLSQSLQVQLQRIREADTEVRWQHDDDVSECPACRAPLPNNKKKVHCRHCGRIFCAACASHQVPAGPRRTPARVCSVCRTLLQPHTAPYFSTEPPHSPA
ncbi:rab GTPase-binding effector protein 1 isoform X6 [Ostrinia furnacalis]|uniref:rab GTPase-binding effector protein 1 isoform X6 n=1 Tax=Ostrinia furnacalis TaxID=93504 RepID=UPI001038CAB8|nr:rab GTPase-binding effector protein 1 isoform X6 [Ostrinia furnacalis]